MYPAYGGYKLNLKALIHISAIEDKPAQLYTGAKLR